MAATSQSGQDVRWTTVLQEQQTSDRSRGMQSSITESVELAKIFLPEKEIEPETLAQVKQMAKHPAVVHCRVMPDCHKGNGCCVGFTCRLTPCMTPQLIGGDIGCGISTHPIPAKFVERKNGLEKLLRRIHEVVPMGNGHSCVHSQPLLSLEDFAPFLDDASEEWATFSNAYKARFDVDLDQALLREVQPVSEHSNATAETDTLAKVTEPTRPFRFSVQWLKDCLKRLGVSTKDFLGNLGTLGGGNHFIEVNERSDSVTDGDAANGLELLPMYLLTVHSGSRCFGQAVYHYFVRMARGAEGSRSLASSSAQTNKKESKKKQRGDEASSEPEVEGEGEGGDDEETIPFDTNLLLTSPAQIASYYLHMILAQKYAAVNRLVMLRSVLGSFTALKETDECEENDSLSQSQSEEDVEREVDDDDEEGAQSVSGSSSGADDRSSFQGDESDQQAAAGASSKQSLFSASSVVSSVHNYIDFTDLIVRKGAIRATKGQTCLIALNMKEGIWWAVGRGNEEWNESAAHGCGRIVGRRRVQNRRQTGSKRDDSAALNKFKAEMDGVLSYSVSMETLDERPSAYRSPGIVKTMLETCHEGTVDIVAQFKVLASAKGK